MDERLRHPELTSRPSDRECVNRLNCIICCLLGAFASELHALLPRPPLAETARDQPPVFAVAARPFSSLTLPTGWGIRELSHNQVFAEHAPCHPYLPPSKAKVHTIASRTSGQQPVPPSPTITPRARTGPAVQRLTAARACPRSHDPPPSTSTNSAITFN